MQSRRHNGGVRQIEAGGGANLCSPARDVPVHVDDVYGPRPEQGSDAIELVVVMVSHRLHQHLQFCNHRNEGLSPAIAHWSKDLLDDVEIWSRSIQKIDERVRVEAESARGR